MVEKFNREGHEIIPEVVALGMVLESLTTALHKDHTLTLILLKSFRSTRKDPEKFKYYSFFHKVKTKSVDVAMLQKENCFNTGIVKPTRARWVLTINILEAALDDFFTGLKANARSSYPLMKNKPGTKKYNEKTGAGPTQWSEDKQAICLQVPLAKKWNDLYQTWNMAFAIKKPFCIYMISKLLIPKVANYKDKPTEYMFHRVNALYIMLHYAGRIRLWKAMNNEKVYYWADKKLAAVWGKVNLESADSYKRELASVASMLK